MSDSERENGILRNVEIFVLERLLTQHNSEGDPLVNIAYLTESMDETMFPLLDQAIEDLVAQSFYSLFRW